MILKLRYEIIDKMLQCGIFQAIFTNISYQVVDIIISLQVAKWKVFVEAKPKDSDLLTMLNAAKKEYFPSVNIMLSLLLSLPVSTAEVERSFSALKRLKTVSRSSIGEARLNGLALPYIHRNLEIPVARIVNLWYSKGERRILTAFD